MTKHSHGIWMCFVVIGLAFCEPNGTFGQQVTVGTPLHGGNSGFFEHFGIGFSLQHVTPNSLMFFRHGNGLSAQSPFGGFDLANASTFGIGGQHGNWSWNLNASAIQGYGQSNVSTTPYLTLPNGGFGFIQDTMQRPFVSAFVPVVGDSDESRRLTMQHFEESAARFMIEQHRQQQLEDEELRRLRHLSRKAQGQRETSSTNLEPPLILGESPESDSAIRF